eukprot:CAMPEP_0114977752 /NCGR_PEP_ID=MMETSP0216-20121206/3414_1 /TAXON_ID=223996 /ORGANISM="Protocruzia adherens, Strain Boccale" /LENGTH=160 /DNA_ID=CAMNT_0002338849 /DNA_START=24 /DNA_END=506 /DNA_ORIENTATION=-
MSKNLILFAAALLLLTVSSAETNSLGENIAGNGEWLPEVNAGAIGVVVKNCGLSTSQFTVSSVALDPTTAVPGEKQTVKFTGSSSVSGTITSVQQSVYAGTVFLSTQQLTVSQPVTAGDVSTISYEFEFPKTGSGTYTLHVSPASSGTQLCCFSFEINVK